MKHNRYADKKILVYGAGVIGSIFAGKLFKSGLDTVILARGNRFREIKENGLILKNVLTGKAETYALACIDELKENDIYDYIIVAVQNNHIDAILPVLAKNKSKNIVFVVNNPLGYEKYITAVGKERIMLGFPCAGGERKEGVVHYFIGKGIARIIQTTTFGELDGGDSARLDTLLGIFSKAGFEPVKSRNMDAWQKTHVAFVVPAACAMYRFNSNNYKLARSPSTIRLMLRAIREGFRALEAKGIPVEPAKLRYYYAPLFLMTAFFQLVFATRIAEYAMAKHTITGKDEIKILNEQFLSLCAESPLTEWKKLCSFR
ncbi:ketopantoate reductase family protein [Treponema sp. OMZ 840]|uniref:ketopantoate reductase family protein n=1 Tax=Treponema sp. OMZ 840 TaxID=244313 RepID=UPI003D8F9AF1